MFFPGLLLFFILGVLMGRVGMSRGGFSCISQVADDPACCFFHVSICHLCILSGETPVPAF